MSDDYGDTLEAQILADYVTGGMTMIDACKTLGLAVTTIYGRIKANEKFREMMETARERGYDAIANNVRAIARGDPAAGASGDWKRDKLIAEMDLKLLAKWHPHKYGEKIQVEQKTASVAIPVSDDPIEAQRAYERLMRGGD